MKPKRNPPFSTKPVSPPPPTPEQIEALAQAIWIDRGRPEGRDLDNWLEAERQLRGEVRRPVATDDIPATDRLLEPDREATNEIDRELDRVVRQPEQRSPTSL
jgi:hypothetical protein